jgi:hypothetical protein
MYQKMMTKAIEKKLPKIGATEKIPVAEKEIIVKFFTPWSFWTWYAVEGQKTEDGDYEFFGLVEGQETEWGYFRLSELTAVRGPFGLKIERDMHFDGYKIKDVQK